MLFYVCNSLGANSETASGIHDDIGVTRGSTSNFRRAPSSQSKVRNCPSSSQALVPTVVATSHKSPLQLVDSTATGPDLLPHARPNTTTFDVPEVSTSLQINAQPSSEDTKRLESAKSRAETGEDRIVSSSRTVVERRHTDSTRYLPALNSTGTVKRVSNEHEFKRPADVPHPSKAVQLNRHFQSPALAAQMNSRSLKSTPLQQVGSTSVVQPSPASSVMSEFDRQLVNQARHHVVGVSVDTRQPRSATWIHNPGAHHNDNTTASPPDQFYETKLQRIATWVASTNQHFPPTPDDDQDCGKDEPSSIDLGLGNGYAVDSHTMLNC